ncbi:phosphatidylinositol mannoside acyltransferase [Nakamurella flavida]|uniref:Phosphatidylinositol mannoside acyltransferase n=1 Tax=Nakamurella flavida TaxID=363630 RepID=A0A939C5Y3_9ACTN|nr:phosphatidylinositol mannoside acyltransferase [Nakamurella flavida]MBM9477419.1 phosphatidylinositol mannoside acyltransferase [Nakamurella flavida]MDP9777352.1 KDO2-lipid IV(A) lauroyltransferase [Nakamurella flavida]
MSGTPPSRRQELTDRAVAAGYGAGWQLVRSLPEPVARAAFRAAADRATARRGPRVVQLARNLHRVLGASATPATLSAVVADGMRSYARYWLETFRLPAMDHAQVVLDVTAGTHGLENIENALEAGRGVVCVLPHTGNWDVAGLMIAQRYGSLTTVAERLKPESVYDRFLAFRESLGMEILPLTGGPAVSQVLKERLRAGGIVCLLGDRDLTTRGIDVSFFGEPTRMPAGPALLAATTGADLLPCLPTFTPTGWKVVIGEPMPLPGGRLATTVRQTTQQLADRFARDIATAPADWHMLQPLWLADLPAARRAALTGAAR